MKVDRREWNKWAFTDPNASCMTVEPSRSGTGYQTVEGSRTVTNGSPRGTHTAVEVITRRRVSGEKERATCYRLEYSLGAAAGDQPSPRDSGLHPHSGLSPSPHHSHPRFVLFSRIKTSDAAFPALTNDSLIRAIRMPAKTVTHHCNSARPVLFLVS